MLESKLSVLERFMRKLTGSRFQSCFRNSLPAKIFAYRSLRERLFLLDLVNFGILSRLRGCCGRFCLYFMWREEPQVEQIVAL